MRANDVLKLAWLPTRWQEGLHALGTLTALRHVWVSSNLMLAPGHRGSWLMPGILMVSDGSHLEAQLRFL